MKGKRAEILSHMKAFEVVFDENRRTKELRRGPRGALKVKWVKVELQCLVKNYTEAARLARRLGNHMDREVRVPARLVLP